MITVQSGMNKLAVTNLLALILVCFTTVVIVPFLAFICMFAHEGGHGMIIVPSVLLNLEIPLVPSENMQENPFKNFPLGILSLFLSFPLGIMANGLLLYLSYRNARFYRHYSSKQELVLMTVFISFCILNLGAVFNNLFGTDFAFIIKDLLKLPSDEQWFRIILRILTYLVFPVVLAIKKEFELDKVLVISLTTYPVNMITGELIFQPLAPVFMANFWWLFIIGLPVFVIIAVSLIKAHELSEKRLKKPLSDHFV